MDARHLMHGLLLGLLAVLVYAGSQAVLRAERPDAAVQTAGPQVKPSSMGATPVTGPAPRARATRTAPPASIKSRPPSPGSISPIPGPATPHPAPPAVPATLSEELSIYVNGLDGVYGVAVENLADGEAIMVNADRIFPSGSLYKVLVMYRVYQFIERGELSTDSTIVFESEDLVEAVNGDGLRPGDSMTIGEAVDWMITFSSNPAAYALARQIGGWNGVLAAAAELGMSDTTWDGSGFVTTPADMLRFFALLGRRDLVSESASDEMTAVLLRQRINDRIPAGLPPGTRVAHKTGELPEVRNDAGIVFGARGPFAIVILSEGIDPPDASRAQAEISRMVYERLGT